MVTTTKPMTQITKNIDLVQINLVPGVREYFLPKNVDWRDRVINKIILVASLDSDIVSPINSTPVSYEAQCRNIYMDLYSDDEKLLANGLSLGSLQYHNNFPFEINSKISLNLSRIYFSQDPSVSEQYPRCLLLYVIYDSEVVMDREPSRKNVTVKLDLAAGQRLSFREIIDNYISVNCRCVRSITARHPELNSSPVFITLRDKQSRYIFNQVYSDMLRPDSWNNSDFPKLEPIEFPDDMDIDLDYSYVQNSSDSRATAVAVTFEY